MAEHQSDSIIEETENLLDDPSSVSVQSIEAPLDDKHERRMEWWRQARLGLFIHWGPYSLPAGEWKGKVVEASYSEHIMLRAKIPITEYEEMAARFNPTAFDAKKWVRTAKLAGLKYIIYTAKHHDGFAMYDSSVSDYSIVKHTLFGRDPLRELMEECQAEGIVLGIYYSHAMDWHDSGSQGNTWDYPQNIGAYDEVETWIHDTNKRTRFETYLHNKSIPQVQELLTNYGEVGLMWFDCGGKLIREQGEQFLAAVHDVQPDCLINSRVWKTPLGDYSNTSDNQLATRNLGRDWENIITLNDSWGYKKADQNWKSPVEIIHQIIDVVSKNGNLVINIGPMATGEWDPISESILLDVGNWLSSNGDSIYGAGKAPTAKPSWGRCTLKENTLYLHVYDRTIRRNLVVPGLQTKVQRVVVLDGGMELHFEQLSEQDLVIELPILSDSRDSSNDMPLVIAVICEGPVKGNPVSLLNLVEEDILELGVFESTISGPTLRYDTGKKDRDNLLDWTNEEDTAVWNVRTLGPLRVQVSIEYRSENGVENGGGGTYLIKAAEQTLRAKVESTSESNAFQRFHIGELLFPAAGQYTILLQAEQITGSYLMQPRCLKLTQV